MHLIANGGMASLNLGNTMDAIMLTKYIKYVDGVKLDVYKTLDDYFVLSSYDDLKKHTLSKKIISESYYEEIKNTKFPSHIFKYYIPLLDDVLKYYINDKKIFLELHFNNAMDKLYQILSKYSYEYNIINEKNADNYLYCDDPTLIDLNEIDNDTYIITKYPEKIYSFYENSTKYN